MNFVQFGIEYMVNYVHTCVCVCGCM